jgi:hypothetical protein
MLKRLKRVKSVERERERERESENENAEADFDETKAASENDDLT